MLSREDSSPISRTLVDIRMPGTTPTNAALYNAGHKKGRKDIAHTYCWTLPDYEYSSLFYLVYIVGFQSDDKEVQTYYQQVTTLKI